MSLSSRALNTCMYMCNIWFFSHCHTACARLDFSRMLVCGCVCLGVWPMVLQYDMYSDEWRGNGCTFQWRMWPDRYHCIRPSGLSGIYNMISIENRRRWQCSLYPLHYLDACSTGKSLHLTFWKQAIVQHLNAFQIDWIVPGMKPFIHGQNSAWMQLNWHLWMLMA